MKKHNPETEHVLQGPPVQAHTLGHLLRELYGCLQESVYRTVSEAGHPGLRALHSPVLRHLPLSGGRVADLARVSGMAKQSMAYIVDDLVGLGYLRVEPDPTDGRARLIHYTENGIHLVNALLAASEQAEKNLAKYVGETRLAELREILKIALLHDNAAG